MLETKSKQTSNEETLVRSKRLEAAAKARGKDKETPIILLTQAHIHYS